MNGAPLIRDRHIFYMVMVLTFLFFFTHALSAAILFLFDLLLLEWLNPLTGFLIVGLIVLVWAATLLVTWRVWRLAGIWDAPQEDTSEDSVVEQPEIDPETAQVSQLENPPN